MSVRMLFAGVRQALAKKVETKQESYAELKAKLVAGKTVAADTIIAVCDACGKSTEELEAEVDAEVKRGEKREIAGKRDGIIAQLKEVGQKSLELEADRAKAAEEFDARGKALRAEEGRLRIQLQQANDAIATLKGTAPAEAVEHRNELRRQHRELNAKLTTARATLADDELRLREAQGAVARASEPQGKADHQANADRYQRRVNSGSETVLDLERRIVELDEQIEEAGKALLV